MQHRLPCLALNIAFQTTRRFLEMQTQPVPDPCSPTARAHPSLPHIPSFTLTRTHTRANAHAQSRAPPHTQAPLAQPGTPTLGARWPASLGRTPRPPLTHAHACTLRAPAPGGGTRWEVGGGRDRPGTRERSLPVNPALAFRQLRSCAKAPGSPLAPQPEE